MGLNVIGIFICKDQTGPNGPRPTGEGMCLRRCLMRVALLFPCLAFSDSLSLSLSLSLWVSVCASKCIMLHYLGFVEFSSVDDCVKALSKNREPMGDRYIEVVLTLA